MALFFRRMATSLGALVLTAVALVWRLKGQVACPVPIREKAMAR